MSQTIQRQPPDNTSIEITQKQTSQTVGKNSPKETNSTGQTQSHTVELTEVSQHQDTTFEHTKSHYCKACEKFLENGILYHLRYDKSCAEAYTIEEINSIKKENKKKYMKSYRQKKKSDISENKTGLGQFSLIEIMLRI